MKRQMLNRYLIGVFLLLVVCLSALVFYVWLGGQGEQPEENVQTGENAQQGVENVDLTYLAQHMEEFENKKIRVEGVVQHYDDMVTETIGDFVILDTNTSVPVWLEDRSMPIPSENSFIVVEGTVECVYGFYITGRYRILADNVEFVAENVDLLYLAEHISEFENKKVRVTGTVRLPDVVAEPPRMFWIDGVTIIVSDYGECPLENSITTVVGTVIERDGGHTIYADNWTYISQLGENSASVIENGIKFTISLDKTEFSLGETINVNLVVQNLREESVTFTFGTPLQFDLLIYDENLEFLGTLSSPIQAMLVTGFSLEPGETRTKVSNWNQYIYSSPAGEYSQLEPGTYYVQGALVRYLTTPSLRIIII